MIMKQIIVLAMLALAIVVGTTTVMTIQSTPPAYADGSCTNC
jgi:hypothetical protein